MDTLKSLRNIEVRKMFPWIISILAVLGAVHASGSSENLEVMNSTVACVRGLEQTTHRLRCEHNGTSGILAVKKVFYGTTPAYRNCSRKAPYDFCCRQDPEENCVFESNHRLDEVVRKCSGKSKCLFHGQSVNSIRGKCDQTQYPDITSFSFLEYSCLNMDSLTNVCPDQETFAEGPTLYLDSNIKQDNGHLDTSDYCSCILYTRCGATLTLEAMFVQLRMINATNCVEEVILQDLKGKKTKSKYSCHDHKQNFAINNQIMLESTSNAVLFKLHIFDNHNGKVLISATTSDPSSNVGLKCGPDVSAKSLPRDYYCNGEAIPEDTNGDGSEEDIDEQQEGAADMGSGTPVVVKKESEELHSGAIAGIVLAIVGIMLVISQVLYFLVRRHQKRIEREADILSQSGASSISPQDLVNPAFPPQDIDYTMEDDEHVYDLVMGTVSGRANPVYNNRIMPEFEDGGAVPSSQKNLEASRDPKHDPDDLSYDKNVSDQSSPPPYELHESNQKLQLIFC